MHVETCAGSRFRTGFRHFVAALFVAAAGCDGSSTSPRDGEAPIELRAVAIADPGSGGGYRLITDYCECFPGSVTLVSTRRPIERVSCAGESGLGYPITYNDTLEVRLLGPTWQVSETFNVILDPHVGLRVAATCLEP